MNQYVYARTLREMDYHGKKIWVVLARSEVVSSIPEKDGVIRVDDYLQSCALTTDGKVGSKGTVHYTEMGMYKGARGKQGQECTLGRDMVGEGYMLG